MKHGTLFTAGAVAAFAWTLTGTAAGQRGGAGEVTQAGPGRGQVQLPDGAGKEIVSSTCNSCHGLNLITGSWGYTKDGWEDRIATMIKLPPDRLNTITAYLGEHFPIKPASGAVLIAGPTNVRITEWMAPTLGSRPHDPLAAADGSIWWSGHFQNRLGRVDPRTGAMKEFPLAAGTAPHGLVEDRQGNIWFTGIQKHIIGRFDPKTGMTTEYPVQKAEPMARSPHTPIFDQKGTLWFTLQSGHVGRLIPATGEMKIVPAPSGAGETYPYGIQVDAQGTPWYVDFRGPRIASVNPATMEVKEIVLANAAARPRRIAITGDGAIWWTDFARGYIGRYDPKTGQQREWLSPGGADSEPYGIASIGGILWYSESNVRPNTLVRFDPASQKFQTWAIPSGGGVIRNMMATPQGNLVLACSGVNRVALVEVSGAAAVTRTN
jgi:virginiamycin B lyase